jgi:uncharacterized protein
MHIQFLGGASGVGATCQLVALGARRILVDAGVRVDSADRLPDLAALDGVSLDAIFITHAHADHIGALPLLADRYPAVPIYANPATIRLIEVMLGDAVRVMARRAADELELPLYDETLVATTLRQLRPLPLGEQSVPELPGVVVHSQRAGHIAGAVSLGFEASDGRLVISGDVSAVAQRTIPGASVPTPQRPELLVLESTYGARLHPNRAIEERKLAEAVIARGGHCLIPAFALGRAQEVILILREAQRDGVIPEFPIVVDGLVRTVCAAYAAIPDALSPGLKRHITNGGKPFFRGTIRPIETPQQRERVLAGPPCAIITSSGMLTGGPSVWYAERLVEQPQAAIFFSGYVDEEAPGRRLLDLADAKPDQRRLTLGERTLKVACEVGRYSLSAHADGDELAAMVRAVQPKTVALVHGDPEARAALAAKLKGLAEVVTPMDGQSLQIVTAVKGGKKVATPNKPTAPAAPVGAGKELSVEQLEQLYNALRDGSGVQSFSVRELARAWYGNNTDENEQQIATVLETSNPYFIALPGVKGLWRVPAPTEVRRTQAAGSAPTGRGPRPDTAAVQATIDRFLSGSPDLYQRSIDPNTGAVTLRYFFPRVAEKRDAEAIRQISEALGAPVTVWPQPHQAKLAALALEVIPKGLTSERAPAIHHNEERVEVRCSGRTQPEVVKAAEASFAAQTGWKLTIRAPEMAALLATTTNEPDSFPPPRGVLRGEVNRSLNSAKTWFGPETGCYKASADQAAGVITLRFNFPEVARERYSSQLANLAEYTGWTIRLWPQPNQEALMQAAKQVLPPGLTPLATPTLQSISREVVLKVTGSSSNAAFESALEKFRTRTGWQLILRGATVREKVPTK